MKNGIYRSDNATYYVLNEKIAKAVCDLFKEIPSNEEGEADNS